MRLWSLHPSYLDARGLVACWREGLLARKVLLGQTTGYRSHPQLVRFRAQPNPIAALDQYLQALLDEAGQRGYAFNPSKISIHPAKIYMTVTDGQLAFELEHLKNKLLKRSPAIYERIARLTFPLPNPIFTVVKGEPEAWERRILQPDRGSLRHC